MELDNPSQGIADIKRNAHGINVIAVVTPNIIEQISSSDNPYVLTLPGINREIIINGSGNDVGQWNNWRSWRVSVDDIEAMTGYDFFSTLPEDIQRILEAKDRDPVASLLAENSLQANSTQGNLGVLNAPIWHYSSVVNDSLTNTTAFDVRAQQYGSSQVSIDENNLKQISSTEISIYEQNIIKLGSATQRSSQPGITQISPFHITVNQPTSAQISIDQLGMIQIGLFNINSPQTSSFKVSSTQTYPSQVSPPQVNASQVDSAEINFNQVNAPEISLPASITLQQLLSSHNFSLQNTTVPTWLEFLQWTTPFNLNIEITDLPTGQLAEATITSFDPTGRPNSGTLTLDIDANSLGWYIDPTPWDNSEYSQTLTDTAYRATLGSDAYGHYDLLTTILHETAHLQGFIAGYSNYDNQVQTINGSKTPGLIEVEAFIGDGFSAILNPIPTIETITIDSILKEGTPANFSALVPQVEAAKICGVGLQFQG